MNIETIISLNVLLTYLVSILWHEVGHLLYFKYVIKKELKLYYVKKGWFRAHWQIGKQEDYKNLSDQEYLGSMVSGVFLGLLIILIVNAMSGYAQLYYPYWLLVVPYLVGCRSDIDQIIKTIKFGNIDFSQE